LTVSQIELTADADASGNVHLDVPTGTPHARVRVKLDMEVAGRKRARTKEEYLEFIDSVFGKCDDPTFLPPPDQTVEPAEPL
jgi:hypothetical protein